MLNSTTYNATNLNSNLAPMIGGGVSAVAESPVPYYNSQIGDAVLQQLAKSMNYYYNHSNPPLKDDSGVTAVNNNAIPLPRKRPRESSMATTRTSFLNNSIDSNGCNNCSLIGKASGRCQEDATVSFLDEDLSLQMMQQRLEVDRLISLHTEKMRLEMEERRRRQSARIIQTIQEAVSRKMKDKEDQIEKIGKLNWALEERIKSICHENQIWRDLAQTNEATANALRSNLEQVISQADGAGGAKDDAESCCGSSGHGCEDEVDGSRVLRWRKVARTSSSGGMRKETTEAALQEEEERMMMKRMCRRCGATESSVLLLPCRHLCLCSACGPTVETCPICSSTKNASVHVNLC